MKIVKDESGVDKTNASEEVNVTIGGVPFDRSKLPEIDVTHGPIKMASVKQIYEQLAPNEIFIISLQGNTLLYVANLLGMAHLKQATLE